MGMDSTFPLIQEGHFATEVQSSADDIVLNIRDERHEAHQRHEGHIRKFILPSLSYKILPPVLLLASNTDKVFFRMICSLSINIRRFIPAKRLLWSLYVIKVTILLFLLTTWLEFIYSYLLLVPLIDVTKQPYVKEEVSVKKKPVTETRQVSEKVRGEKVRVSGSTTAED